MKDFDIEVEDSMKNNNFLDEKKSFFENF